jgi:hypothetical protein
MRTTKDYSQPIAFDAAVRMRRIRRARLDGHGDVLGTGTSKRYSKATPASPARDAIWSA